MGKGRRGRCPLLENKVWSELRTQLELHHSEQSPAETVWRRPHSQDSAMAPVFVKP